ncbi:hypothetical protein BDV38DRAFT_284911 [Aspergillus pseudotamarii]|uniref:Uncharacterized protein n=1 Tax=Aspergillus pseudotamarii TaxID=132259 RepID=A0A5N6SQ36_ASPPS|nr:uncharacterized protein BDV38DRAFT_284911 [Aspergillus pseudotamarii]KAE8135473.1 hypothetical protein BDV38DRAFT_284911 [Aspergillus pseudotamarii]
MVTTKINKDLGYIAILDLILESGFEIEVTNELVMSAFNARHGSVLQTFLEHKVDIKLSQEMANTVLELEYYDALKVLVKYENPRELDLQDAVPLLTSYCFLEVKAGRQVHRFPHQYHILFPNTVGFPVLDI